jgi:hypothetical protein
MEKPMRRDARAYGGRLLIIEEDCMTTAAPVVVVIGLLAFKILRSTLKKYS